MEIVSSAKKARTTPQMQHPTHPTQAPITPAPPLNATKLTGPGVMAMSDVGESQIHPTKKRSSQAADDNVTPVRPSKKVKATGSELNVPQSLHRTGLFSSY